MEKDLSLINYKKEKAKSEMEENPQLFLLDTKTKKEKRRQLI